MKYNKTTFKIIKLTAILCLPIFFVAFSRISPDSADDYKVIKVIGSIIVKNTGNPLSQGDVIGSSEAIIFKSAGAKASVISKADGRLILAANGQSKSEGSSLKNNLLPAMSNISSRSGSILNVLDLHNYCQGNHLILDEEKIFVSPKAFPMNDTGFFFARYTYKGEVIDKKLSHKKDTLVINRKQLFTIDDIAVENPEAVDISLFYYSRKVPRMISKIQLVFADKIQLKKELKTLLDEMTLKSYQQKLDEITSYLNEFYGKPDEENLKLWLRLNMAFVK
jgi:hypothetical protein